VAEFGVEVAIGETFLAAASRLSQPGSSLTQRVALAPNPRPFTGLDLWSETFGLPVADAAGNGPSQLLEYVFNLDPRANRTGASAQGVSMSGEPALVTSADNRSALHFIRPVDDPRLNLIVETSSNLTDWEPLNTPPEVLASGGAYQLCSVQLPAGPAIFARLKITYNRDY
jgi:hypothetical protein